MQLKYIKSTKAVQSNYWSKGIHSKSFGVLESPNRIHKVQKHHVFSLCRKINPEKVKQVLIWMESYLTPSVAVISSVADIHIKFNYAWNAILPGRYGMATRKWQILFGKLNQKFGKCFLNRDSLIKFCFSL